MKKLLLLSILVISEAFAQVPQKTPPPMKLSDPLPANLFTELSRIINPAIVNISTSVMARGNRGLRGRDPMLDLLEQFYGQQIPQGNPNRPQQMGLGSGFIIREDGLIITNNHVIEGADIIQVQVQLADGKDKMYEATVVGSDPRTDIALLKIKPDGKLPVAALGNSKDLKVGEWVAAFGNPFGHAHTLTKGIVSSMGREIAEINRFPLIQTDASINPGNSGGPLVDTRGYVIGVNSAIDPRAQGIGFAIPIDEVKKILPDLESRGSLRKGYLGLRLGDHNEQSAEEMGFDEKYRGAVVLRVEPGQPGAKAGIKPFETITEFGGKKIRNSVELMDTVAGQEPGSKVEVKLMAPNKKTRTVTLTVAERPSETRIGKNSRGQQQNVKGEKAPHNLGFIVADLNDQLRQDLQIAPDVKKPVIVGVDRSSMAALAGILPGDIILEVNKKEVTTAGDVIKGLKKGSNTLRLVRGNQLLVITFG